MGLVSDNELGPCSGVVVSAGAAKDLGIPAGKFPCATDMDNVRIKGFDGRWRCKNCQRIHAEIVMAETKMPGESPS
jgi:hypothetical protein